MSRVVHFEIMCEHPEKVSKFYRDVFGWNIQKWEGPMEYWLVSTGDPKTPGIDGGIAKTDTRFPAVTNTIDVPSIDEYDAKIEKAGGTVHVPKHAIPGVGWIAYFKDPDGVISGIYHTDPNAK